MGMDFSGGSCDEEYDSVMCGITTCENENKLWSINRSTLPLRYDQ